MLQWLLCQVQVYPPSPRAPGAFLDDGIEADVPDPLVIRQCDHGNPIEITAAGTT
jgi:hypothetical protein